MSVKSNQEDEVPEGYEVDSGDWGYTPSLDTHDRSSWHEAIAACHEHAAHQRAIGARKAEAERDQERALREKADALLREMLREAMPKDRRLFDADQYEYVCPWCERRTNEPHDDDCITHRIRKHLKDTPDAD